jgi:flagellar export protein FliJ
MSQSHRRVQKGETLQRIRALQERAQKAQTVRADDLARRREGEADHRRQELRSLDDQALDQAREGVSMQHFLRYQELRDIHHHALDQALCAHQDAVDALDEERRALLDAVHSRRAAERLLETARHAHDLEQRRQEQRRVDDITCARAAINAQAGA